MDRLFGSRLNRIYVHGDLKRQGAGRAAIAHFFAMLLVILFSAGSLDALGADDLNSVLQDWQASHSLNIPWSISLAMSFFMVLAMDIGPLYAASVLRVMAARRSPLADRWVHIAVIVVVSMVEAGTYLDMSWTYEDLARKSWANGHTSIDHMRRATGMSRTAAQSWVRTLKAEDAVRAQQTAQSSSGVVAMQPLFFVGDHAGQKG